MTIYVLLLRTVIEDSWKTLSDRVKIPESDRDSFRSVWWDWEPTGQDWLTPSLLPSFFLPLSFNFSSFAAYSIFRWSHVFNVRLTRFSLDKSLFLPHLLQGIYNNNTTLLLQTSCKKFESTRTKKEHKFSLLIDRQSFTFFSSCSSPAAWHIMMFLFIHCFIVSIRLRLPQRKNFHRPSQQSYVSSIDCRTLFSKPGWRSQPSYIVSIRLRLRPRKDLE